ncbi:indole-3-glycerol phosphate synthase TrpC [Evansella vedderi]|uniref:indole-3-glycerol phosphate synthase TrpC n=1 Tax=Evansella vedderi TaxID=38282 RepID=UPI0027D7F5A1|nr:indole-3-glycerol phosphate synthase TrpC [Evansella vedderi]
MLDQIVEQKKQEVTQLGEINVEGVTVEGRSFYEALLNPNHELGVIAEVKKASPSKGVLVENFEPVQIAKEYEKSGADAISVLTDERYFKGHRSYLTQVKKHTALPVLRKDFIIDEIQIYESKSMGADAILLIAAILSKTQIKEYMSLAEELSLDVLMEVHDEEELDKVMSTVHPKILGVNNRNLKTFETTLETSNRLSKLIPKDVLFISESGIRSKEDINFLKEINANGILVGETLMVEKNKTKVFNQWFGEASLNGATS